MSDSAAKTKTKKSNFLEKIGFPYESLRSGQAKFLKYVYYSVSKSKNLLVCAPTGLGKTVSGLAPALFYAKKKKMTVICLTSRQTQANQYIKTIKDISLKSGKKINFLAFIGKRNMCAHKDRELYPPSDFNEFCKKAKESGKCKFFRNTKNEDFEKKIKAILAEGSDSFMTVENFVSLCESNKLCPYEIAGKKAHHCDVVICDYNYMFSQGIKESFLGRVGRDINECILVVDEGHNLPDRIRSAYSYSLSTELIKKALKELEDFIKSSEYDHYIRNIKTVLEEIYFDKMLGTKEDYLISKDDFFDAYMKTFKQGEEFAKIMEKLFDVEMLVKEERVVSYVGRIASFLDRWYTLDEESYLRLLEKKISKNQTILSLNIKCIDPSQIAAETLNNSHSSIVMSATLSPISMYRDILGIKNESLLELPSPFAQRNQLTLVASDVTTKYTFRDNDMYDKIANNIANMLTQGSKQNAIVFFPSYALMEKILDFLPVKNLNRRILRERQFMSKEDKEKYIEKFQSSGRKPTVLFAVVAGSFAEGLDLPNKSLEMVIVVGLPLGVPDLTTKAIIRHFDKKFRKGQMYGYIYPAMSKIIQAGGRCIRTEEDKGVVVLMDSRYMWPLYAQCFPKHWFLEKYDDENFDISNFFDWKN